MVSVYEEMKGGLESSGLMAGGIGSEEYEGIVLCDDGRGLV